MHDPVSLLKTALENLAFVARIKPEVASLRPFRTAMVQIDLALEKLKIEEDRDARTPKSLD